MLRKITFILLITLLLSTALFAAGLFALDWYLGTERFRTHLSQAISDAYGYEVTFQGNLGVSVYPWLGLETGPLEVRSAPGKEPLLRASEVSAKVSLVHLFSRQLNFDTVFLNKIEVSVQRKKNGSTNIDALLALLLPQGESKPVMDPALRLDSLSVRGVQLHNAHFRFDDEVTGQTWTVADAGFQTGEFEQGRPLPFSMTGTFTRSGLDVEASLDMSGNLETDLAANAFQLLDTRVNLILRGETLPVRGGEIHFTSRLDLNSVKGEAQLHDFHLKLPQLMLAGDMRLENLKDAPRAEGELRSGVFSPRAAVNDFFPGTIPEKDPEIFKNGNFSLSFKADASGVDVKDLKVFCDKTNVTGEFSVHGFDNPDYRFTLKGDSLDFDRYYRLFVVDEPFYLSDFFPDFFAEVHAGGSVDLDSVILAGERIEGSHWAASCGNGTLRVDVAPAKLKGGSLKAGFEAAIARSGDGEYSLGLGLDVRLDALDAADLPLLSAGKYRIDGKGGAQYSMTMPPTPFKASDVIDDVLLTLEGHLAYDIDNFRLRTPPSDGSKGRTVMFGKASGETDFKPTRAAYKEGGFAFSFKGGARGADHDYSSWLSFTGTMRANRKYADLRLDDVKVKGRYEGGDLPEYAPAFDFFVNGGLEADKQYLRLKDVQVSGFGGDFTATLEGHRIFEKDYTLTGGFEYDTDNPLGLLRWMSLKPGKPRGGNAYTNIHVRSKYSVTPYKAVFHHCEIGMDGASATGVVRIEDYATGKLSFDLSAGTVDIDQYRPNKGKRRDPKECVDPTQVRPIGLPVETLRDLNAEGTLRVKDLILYKLHFTDLKGEVRARDGQLTGSPLAGTFYGGKLEGGFTARSTKEFIVLSLNLKADDFKVGPFMADVGGKEYVMGRGTLFMDVQSLGATDDDVIANLEGRGGFTVEEGSYKFSGKAGGESLAKGEQSILEGRNRFNGAGAIFRIDHGAFYNEDFNMEASFMELGGRGEFNIDTNTIDLELEANYKAGPTVPLHIVGCLDDPAVEVPGGELITNTVRDLIGIPLKPFQYLRDLLF
jgi:AsmA protein